MMGTRALQQCCAFSTRYHRGQSRGLSRDVRTAIQLRPSRPFERAWSSEEVSTKEAYWRGYEEGLLAAQRQHLAQVHQASAAAPLEAAAPLDTARQHAQQAQGGQQQAQQVQQDQPCCADSVLRTAVKGLSWRFFSTGATILLAFVVLGGKVRWSDTLKLGLYEFVSKYILYFVHERIWAAIRLVK